MSEQAQCKWFMACPMKFYREQGRIDSKWIENYCFNNGKNCIRYEKEEKGSGDDDRHPSEPPKWLKI
jgi:hypothetical protein